MAERDAALRALGISDAEPPPDPQSILGVALAVHEREQREEALGGLMMEGSRAIFRESACRRR